ncbi:transposable element Tcb2 transposase [Trichonephila clavipes]|nr:transposable element Tcb2 transposase [Trichonephila clavipes]
MEWPACSPDMNPIEHVWNALERRVAGRQPPPQTLQELKRALLEEWDRIPRLVINSLIDSMPQRVARGILVTDLVRNSDHLSSDEGCAITVVKVSDHDRHVMSSSPVPLKTRRVRQRCTLNLLRAETSFLWCGVAEECASSGVVHVT